MAKAKQRLTNPNIHLDARMILLFWLPLAFSWVLMTVEGPWIQGVIARKPDAELQLAAFGLNFSLAVTIQSPVILLLATSSTLSRDKQSFRILFRFMMVLNIILTIVGFLMAFTPLLDAYLGQLLGIPQEVIDATRPGVALLIMWPPFIGFRRFLQGILIRNDHTRYIGYGSVIRIIVSGGVAFLFGVASELPGAVIGSLSLVSAVGAEAAYAYFVSRGDVARTMATERDPALEPLTYGGAARFHLPLALTSLMTLLVRPVIESGLASTENATQVLAAWPVVFSIFLVVRAGTYAWQEVVITLASSPQRLKAIQRFTLWLGLGSSGLLALVAFTPLIDIYVGTLLGIPEHLQPLITTGARIGVLLPFFTAIENYFRAILMISNNTSPIYQGMIISFIMTAITMWFGLDMGWEPMTTASLSLTTGILLELVWLWRISQRNQSKLKAQWELNTQANH